MVWQDSGILPLLVILSAGAASAQSDVGKTIMEKLTAKIAKLESACAKDIKKYCRDVTPGEGRMIYCMQAHEDKISPKCAFELGEAAIERAKLGGRIEGCSHRLQGRDHRRMREDGAGPGTNCRMPDGEQVDGVRRLQGRACRKSKRWRRNSRRQAPAVDCDCSQTPDHAMRVSFTQLPLLARRCRIRSEKCPQRKNEAGPLIELRHS